ncbi:MAG: hypothetical protein JKX67_01245 [Colwellia sp.]|nr:hypothetical protein [Colwellia sp.]
MRNYKKIWLIYVTILHLFIGVVLLKSNFIEKVSAKNGLYQQPEISNYYNLITSYHKRMDGSIPMGATIFIGDSITQGLAVSAVSPLSVNYGIGSDTTLGVLERLPMYKSIDSAKSIVIAIGVNDLKRRGNNEILYNYKKILEYIPHDKNIVISAILPVDENVQSVKVSNERIFNLNLELHELTRNYNNVVFVNSRSLLQNTDRNLKDNFHIGDGVHLSTDGYEVWINQIKSALKMNNEN